MRIAYISDLDLRSSGGGSYAVNWHAFQQLQRHFEVVDCGPVVPKAPVVADYVSKVRRKLLRRPGKFAYFSPVALDRNARMIGDQLASGADAVFFRSATPWCRYLPKVPYFIYLDAVFHTFFHNTFRPVDFVSSDIQRIWCEEAEFLEGASAVFFESRWGMDQAVAAYGLQGSHYHAVGRGGVIDPPLEDTWDGTSLRLTTLAMKFHQKGGDLVLAAYRLLKPRFPGLSWHIIGGPPEGDWQTPGGIHYEGVLNPDEPGGRDRLRDLLAQAFLLVHPTREDTSPLVVTEAAYFGCPTISVNRFALPELVLAGKSGLLLDMPVTAEGLAEAIEGLITGRDRYLAMRQQARLHAMEHYQWDCVGDLMAAAMVRSQQSGGQPFQVTGHGQHPISHSI
jgi:glycosyltransferase involved in cell wall biosynthesis